jgi:hypothetical protein
MNQCGLVGAIWADMELDRAMLGGSNRTRERPQFD